MALHHAGEHATSELAELLIAVARSTAYGAAERVHPATATAVQKAEDSL